MMNEKIVHELIKKFMSYEVDGLHRWDAYYRKYASTSRYMVRYLRADGSEMGCEIDREKSSELETYFRKWFERNQIIMVDGDGNLANVFDISIQRDGSHKYSYSFDRDLNRKNEDSIREALGDEEYFRLRALSESEYRAGSQ